MINALILEQIKPIWAAAPINITGVGMAGDWINLAKARRIAVVLMAGAWAAGTPAFTLLQATDNTGAGSKALNFDRWWKATGLTTDTWVETALVSTNTFNLLNAANTIYAVETYAAQLDTVNNFNHVSFTVADPAAADLLAAMYLVGELNFPSYPTTQETMID